MKKFIKTISIILCLTMVISLFVPKYGIEIAQAADFYTDENDLWGDDDEWGDDDLWGDDDEWEDDYEWEDDDEWEDNYDDINKTFDVVSISQAGGHSYSKFTLRNGKTNVYPINIKKKTEYIIGFTDSSYGKGSILIVDSNGNNIFEQNLDFVYEKWSKKITLSEGKYYIKILSKESIGFEYELYVKPAVVIKKETKNLKITSCDISDLNPKLGKGKWTTSNKNIITIISKNTKSSSTCKIRAKKTGKATVTYTNSNGSVIKYVFTVSANSSYPFDQAYFTMDTVGGLEPHILISNNSNKRIKYVYLTVSFYNAVGDKVKNEIGGYSNAKLQITGPINAWDFEWYEWNPVFYNTTATKMKVEKMTVIYTDGSKKTKTINKKYSIK